MLLILIYEWNEMWMSMSKYFKEIIWMGNII